MKNQERVKTGSKEAKEQEVEQQKHMTEGKKSRIVEVERHRSTKTEKQRSRETEKQKSRESQKKKSREAEKQRSNESREAEKQRSNESREAEKQRSREAGKYRTRNPKKNQNLPQKKKTIALLAEVGNNLTKLPKCVSGIRINTNIHWYSLIQVSSFPSIPGRFFPFFVEDPVAQVWSSKKSCPPLN